MYIGILLMVGLIALPFQAYADDNPSVHADKNQADSLKEPIPSSVTIVTDKPVDPSVKDVLNAPDDSYVEGYVEGKDLNAEDEELDDPDEMDADTLDDEDGEDDEDPTEGDEE